MADRIQKVVEKVGVQANKKHRDKTLNDVEIEDTKDEDLYITEMRQNIINNQDKIKLNFIKISHLQDLDDAVKNDEKLDDEKREELREGLEEQAIRLSAAIASSVFGDIEHKHTDNQAAWEEGYAYAGYVSSDDQTIHNDIDARQANFLLDLGVCTSTLGLGYRYFTEVDEYREWLDWYEIDIKL